MKLKGTKEIRLLVEDEKDQLKSVSRRKKGEDDHG